MKRYLPKKLAKLRPGFGNVARQHIGQIANHLAVLVHGSGEHGGDLLHRFGIDFGGCINDRLRLQLPGLCRLQFCLGAGGQDACLDGGDQVVDLLLGRVHLLPRCTNIGHAPCCPLLEQPRGLFCEQGAGLFAEKLLLEHFQQPCLCDPARQAQAIGARTVAAIEVHAAAVGRGAAHFVVGAADPALEQAREQIFGAAACHASLGGCIAQSQLDARSLLVHERSTAGHGLGPKVVRHDAKLWHLDNGPFAGGPLALHALAAFRVLAPLAAVPFIDAHIELVAEDACALLRAAIDGGLAPLAATRRGHASAVEFLCDLTRRPAICVALEDFKDDRGLVLIHCAAHCLHQRPAKRVLLGVVFNGNVLVSIGAPACAIAIERLALEAAVCLLPQIVQVHFIHQAAEAALHLLALLGAVIAVTGACDAKSPEFEVANDGLGFDVIARKAREVIHHQHVKLPNPGCSAHCLVSRAVL